MLGRARFEQAHPLLLVRRGAIERRLDLLIPPCGFDAVEPAAIRTIPIQVKNVVMIPPGRGILASESTIYHARSATIAKAFSAERIALRWTRAKLFPEIERFLCGRVRSRAGGGPPSRSRISGIHSRCSGFMAQARRQTISSTSQWDTGPDGSSMSRGRWPGPGAGPARPRRRRSAGLAPTTRSPSRPGRPRRRCPARAGRRDEPLVLFQGPVEDQCRLAARLEPSGKCTAGFKREQSHRRPECRRRGPGPRAFQRDLAQVQLGRAEVGVGRVMPVEPADGRVAEKHAAAAIRLEPVLVRVDDDRIRLTNAGRMPPGSRDRDSPPA